MHAHRPRGIRGRAALVLTFCVALAASLLTAASPAHAGPYVDGFRSCEVRKYGIPPIEKVRICIKIRLKEQDDGLGYTVSNLRIYTYNENNDAQNCRGVDAIEGDFIQIDGINLVTGVHSKKWRAEPAATLNSGNGCYKLYDNFAGDPVLDVNYGAISFVYDGFARMDFANDTDFSVYIQVKPNGVQCGAGDDYCADPR